MRTFSQVDVFSSEPLLGNPVAVVHDADGIGDQEMATFARWTNLSETTFVLTPTNDRADYRLRIFTPGTELPFAGHPTIGSAHAWLEAGGEPRSEHEVIQECAAGLVRLKRGNRLAFAAPPLIRQGPVGDEDRERIVTSLGIKDAEVVDMAWADNGPGWVAVLLESAERVLALEPDFVAMGNLDIGVVGPHDGNADADVEVRAFCPDMGIGEDPVTGSLNASIGQWLAGNRLPASYVAAQGTAIGRRGRVHIETDGNTLWVGGDALTTVTGHVAL
jgi:PhzF family phenazine biosynthesis protein